MKERLEQEKQRKIALVKDYDKSEGVNSFILNGQTAWLDKATRVGLINSLQIEKSAGRVESTLWLNGKSYVVNIDMALQMLVVLELYAKDCYNVTEQHIANIEQETDLNRVYNYNYTKGYPKKLKFDI